MIRVVDSEGVIWWSRLVGLENILSHACPPPTEQIKAAGICNLS